MNSAIEEKKQYLLHWMYDFIEDDDEPAYLKKDVEELDQVISAFILEVGESPRRSDFSWVCSQVEVLIKQLNQLNLKHEHQLIETDQREDICALVSLVLESAGHNSDEDITEQWREW